MRFTKLFNFFLFFYIFVFFVYERKYEKNEKLTKTTCTVRRWLKETKISTKITKLYYENINSTGEKACPHVVIIFFNFRKKRKMWLYVRNERKTWLCNTKITKKKKKKFLSILREIYGKKTKFIFVNFAH